MAEFQEVMKQYMRMCKAHDGGRCRECPASGIMGTCLLMAKGHTVAELEGTIMRWTSENPEPVYPTWIQWHEKMFPDAHDLPDPCCYISRERLKCDDYQCEKCRKQRIPADIAEKLGVKPGKEWEK